MVAWIEPLQLEMWIMNVFAGNRNYFTAIALLAITGLAGYFRMTALSMMFMIVMFLFMFTGYVDPSIGYLVLAIGGLLLGYWIKRVVT